jgi:serine phosphatase RsbU (regulator of sigma subunit)
MISRIWRTLLNLGLQTDMAVAEQKALRVFNGLSVICMPIPPVVSLMINNWQIVWQSFLTNTAMSLAFLGILVSNHFKKFWLGKFLYFTMSGWVILFHVYLFGEILKLEITFFVLFIGAFAFSHKQVEIILLSAIIVAGYFLAIYISHYYPPLIPVKGDPVLVQIFFSAIIFCVSFVCLWMIRSQHKQHEQIIQESNKQLMEQKEEIEAQHSKIISTSNELATKNSAITASINYAQRIQQAILPSVTEIQRNLPDSFIYYKPRDIVSGDFYWHLHFYQKTYFAIADCTGHGVPGAFMSMLGSSLLNLIVQSTFADSPKLILKYLDLQITQMLTRGRDDSREGMEIVLGVFDKAANSLKVASTNRPYFLYRDEHFEEFKGSKGFIGKSLTEKRPFEEQVHAILPGDCFYFFTDGITDQFDAHNKKKYTIRRLREFTHDIHKLDMYIQQSLLDKELELWRGDTIQTDDMLLMGIRF